MGTRYLAILFSIGALACGKSKENSFPETQNTLAEDSESPLSMTIPSELPIACEGIFSPDSGEAALRHYFGTSAVRDARIEVGEGETVRGTIVDQDSPESRIEILWKDTLQRRKYDRVILRNSSKRTTYNGIQIGTSLKSLEEINGRPFQLTGFEWDYSGTVTSWNGGALDTTTTDRCRLLVRLNPSSDSTAAEDVMQILGDRDFSSSNPHMQNVNPTVYEIVLIYK